MDAIKNFALTTITVAPSPSTTGTSLTVANAAKLPVAPFSLSVWPTGEIPTDANCEILRVTDISPGGVLTVTRTQEGTTTRSISVGDSCGQMITAALISSLGASGGGEVFDPGWDGQGQNISEEANLVPVAITQTLTQIAVVANNGGSSGSVTVTVKKYTPSGGALGSPTTLGTIVLSSAVHARSTGLSWSVTAGDVLEFTPSSITTVTRLRAKIAP